jgi:hypothetical protein
MIHVAVTMKRIISLTSIPSRFKHLHTTLQSLSRQACADEIRLYIPRRYKRFTDWDGTLPDVPGDIKIIRTEADLGPATKILPCAKDLKNENVQILFCDDDGIHPRNWARKLFEAQASRPAEAVATYGRLILAELPDASVSTARPIAVGQRMNKNIRYRFDRLLEKTIGIQAYNRPIKSAGYVDLLFGVGGVVVRPNFFDESSLEIPEEAFFVDDVWLSAQLAKKSIPIYCPKRFPMPRESSASFIEALYDYEISGNRFEQNSRAAKWCRDHLGVWK